MSADQFQAGIEILKGIAARTGVQIEIIIPDFDTSSQFFHFVRGENTHQLQVPNEFISDLAGTKDYQRSASAYFEGLKNRLRNVSPQDFYTICGRSLSIAIAWPFQRLADRDGSAVQVTLTDLCEPDSVAIVAVLRTGQARLLELRADFFHTERRIINSVRYAVDAGLVAFFPKREHPDKLLWIPVEPLESQPQEEVIIREFLFGKVYWLGFRRRERRTPVFIADPWDAHYLGTDPRLLLQTAQVLEAEGLISLDASQEFASAAPALLLNAPPSGTRFRAKGGAAPADKPDWNPRPLRDIFICHASEDKAECVRPLAEALLKKGVKVWYDEFELKLGDSLRRSIDRGLRDSRYGVVVLSQAFFSKEWPQKELDGLTAREVNGQKVILPIWHKVSKEHVLSYSPTLADRMAASTSDGLESIVKKIIEAISN